MAVVDRFSGPWSSKMLRASSRLAAWLDAVLHRAPALGWGRSRPIGRDRTCPAGSSGSRATRVTPRWRWKRPLSAMGPPIGPPSMPTVDLVAAVHIAEKSYYEQLNREFEGYDAVLYELGGPRRIARCLSRARRQRSSDLAVAERHQGPLGAGVPTARDRLRAQEHDPCRHVARPVCRVDAASAARASWACLCGCLGYAMTRQSESDAGASNGQLLLAPVRQESHLGLEADFRRAV